MVLHEWDGPLGLEERPVPEPASGEVLVEVAVCGVGDTLNNMRRGRNASLPGVSLPRVIGHEAAGTVVACGPDVEGVEAGAAVAVYMYLTCGRCAACRFGHDPLCSDFRGYVGMAQDGGLAEYLVVPAANLVHVPEGVTLLDAAVAVDAVATPWHALTRVAPLRPVDSLVVVGAGGGVGAQAVRVGRLLGAQVIGVEVTEAKLDFVRGLGAVAVDGRSSSVVEDLADATSGRGADVVLDYVATSSTMGTALACLSPGGALVVQGVGQVDSGLEISPRELIGREVSIRGARYASRAEVVEVLDLVARGSLVPVVTHTVPLERTEELFGLIARRELHGRGAVVQGG